MVLIPKRYSYCGSDQVVKPGKIENAKQRYLCQQPECQAQTFILDDDYQSISLKSKNGLLIWH